MNSGFSPLSMDVGSEVAGLIELLHQTDRRLEELLAGQVDSVTDRSGQTIMLRKAQWQLRLAEQEREASMLNALPARIALLDASGVIVSVNSAWAAFAQDASCGAAGHATGLNYLDICDQSVDGNAPSAAAIAQRVRSVLRGDETQPALDYRWICARELRWFSVKVSPLAGTPGQVVVMHIDVTARKEAAESAERLSLQTDRRERMLTTMLSSISDFAYIFDQGGRFLFANQPLLDLWGLALEDVVGKDFHQLGYPPELATRLQAQLAQVLATGASVSGETPFVSPAGAAGYYEYIFSPACSAGGKVDFVAGCTRDITARRAAQQDLRDLNADLEGRVRERTAQLNLAREEAERANGAKSEFLAAMSHEIRTPMSGLLGMLQLLGLSALDAEQHSTLAVARQSGKALLRIIDDILDFSKIEANCLELNVAPGSIREVVEAACTLHSQVASSKNLTLGTNISPDVAACLGFDALRLGQILHNFLSNAIKFTEAGRIDVSVDVVGQEAQVQRLRFQVRDTGIGMTEEQRLRLFRPFTQASRETSARFGGTGLGLVIARRLAELMGGTLDISSEAGKGTTLTLTAPFEVRAAAQAPRAAAGHGPELLALVAGRRAAPSLEEAQRDGSLLLLVDDHPINRRVLLGQVASLGYAAEAVSDGVQALEAWKTGRYGAVITDCNMPHMNGYEFAAAVRALEAGQGLQRIPIIGCTANALASGATQCIEAGMDDCVVKPVDLEEMGRRLDRWLPVSGPGQATRTAIRSFSAGSAGLLDMMLLGEISGGDEGIQAEILREFQRVNELDAVTLRRCCADRDFAAVMQSSHRIKGSCLMLGATLLAQACGALEAAGASRQEPVLTSGIDRFETELLRLNLHLDAVLAGIRHASQGSGAPAAT